jgi:hypothetical protein
MLPGLHCLQSSGLSLNVHDGGGLVVRGRESGMFSLMLSMTLDGDDNYSIIKRSPPPEEDVHADHDVVIAKSMEEEEEGMEERN